MTGNCIKRREKLDFSESEKWQYVSHNLFFQWVHYLIKDGSKGIPRGETRVQQRTGRVGVHSHLADVTITQHHSLSSFRELLSPQKHSSVPCLPANPRNWQISRCVPWPIHQVKVDRVFHSVMSPVSHKLLDF
jgi:hypothetical protein